MTYRLCDTFCCEGGTSTGYARAGFDVYGVEYVRLADVAPAIRNPRTHRNLDEVKASIRRSGFVEGAVHDGRTDRIIAGHGRLEALAAMEKADEPMPDGVVAADDGAWMMPLQYGWSSADDDEAERMVIWLNRAPERGGWDDTLLAEMLDHLHGTDLGLDGTGYSGGEFDDLVQQVETTRVREHERKLAERDDVDELPPLPAVPVTQLGDVWRLGRHRIMCGDSRNADDIGTLMNGVRADLLFTSPPYNVGIKYDVHDDRTKPWEDYRPLLEGVLTACKPHVIDGGAVCWNIGVSKKVHPTRQLALLEDVGLSYVRTMLWRKVGVALPVWHYTQEQSRARVFTPDYAFELVYVFANGDALAPGGKIEVVDTLRADVFTINQREATEGLREEVGGDLAHPAAFPVALPAAFVNALADVGAAVLDPFGGAASTLLAAHDERRVGYCMELSPAYVDVACTRWHRLTGEAPVLDRTGEAHDFAG